MFTQINSIEDLETLNKELKQKPHIGVDTEFRRTTKYNMRLALLQINDGDEIYLIDPLLIEEPKDQCDFLFSDSVIKIFHSCKEDIEAIHSWTGKTMGNLFDTQLAEAFLNGEYSISYQGLVDDRLEIKINKMETRSNWIRRPLTDSQLDYAASDVEFLIYLFFDLEAELIESKKLDWHKEEMEHLISRAFLPPVYIEDMVCNLPKDEENNLLNKFNEAVINIARVNAINPTLLFSKKNQKVFLRRFLQNGREETYKTITQWRLALIKDTIEKILVGY